MTQRDLLSGGVDSLSLRVEHERLGLCSGVQRPGSPTASAGGGGCGVGSGHSHILQPGRDLGLEGGECLALVLIWCGDSRGGGCDGGGGGLSSAGKGHAWRRQGDGGGARLFARLQAVEGLLSGLYREYNRRLFFVKILNYV